MYIAKNGNYFLHLFSTQGFYARPKTNPDGSMDILTWDCGIPAKEGSLWAGGVYPLTIKFGNSYPANPPVVTFNVPLPHPNIFSSGAVCLSILSYDWKPTINLKQVCIFSLQNHLSSFL